MKRTSVRYLSFGITVAALLGVTSGTAGAKDSEKANKALYLQYCGSCHGPDGKGNGVMASALQTKPADLTQISKKNGGEFPTVMVEDFIRGKRGVPAHGDPDMPVWGQVFREDAVGRSGASSAKSQVHLKIAFITQYIKSIQEK